MRKSSSPREDLPENAKNAWHRVYSFHVKRGTWEPVFAMQLDVIAATCALYLDLSETLRGLDAATDLYAGLAKSREETRLITRKGLEAWGYLKPQRARLAVVNDAGLDADLVAICAPLA